MLIPGRFVAMLFMHLGIFSKNLGRISFQNAHASAQSRIYWLDPIPERACKRAILHLSFAFALPNKAPTICFQISF
jgi:hypothetical protein